MEIIRGIDNLKRSFRNPVVTLGNFDGVHLGHQQIFEAVKQEATKLNGEGMVITFDPHPLKVLAPEKFLPLLTSFSEKMKLIEKSGIQTVLCIEFSPAFSETTPSEFIEAILVKKINVKKVIIGYNYHFGKDQKGDAQRLKEAGKVFHFEVEIMEALKVDQTVVSSSKIRDLIQKGKVEEAFRLLGRDYRITGRVVQGAKRGATLGFPTANLRSTEELFPKSGVYAVGVIWNDRYFNGLANIGLNPTFSPDQTPNARSGSLEVYILDFHQNIYGDEIEVIFKRRIREEVRFDSPALLIDQIKKDIQWAQENVFSKNE